MATVEFYFDYSCPWTYLAFGRLQEAAIRTGSEVVWKPISLPEVLAATGGQRESSRLDAEPRRAAYQRQDLQDWGQYCGVTISLPEDWPHPVHAAMCGAVAADALGEIVPYSRAVFAAYFEAGRNIGDADIVAELGVGVGLQASEFRRLAGDAASARRVQQNCAELVDRGGFDSGTMFVHGHMFCGNSRMPLVEFALGQASGRSFVMPGQHS